MSNYFVIFLLLFPVSVLAHGWDHGDTIIHETTNEYTIVEENTDSSGAATAIAMAQCSRYWGTERLQGCVGIGAHDNEEAISGSLSKKIDDILYTGSIGYETDVWSAGIGASWLF